MTYLASIIDLFLGNAWAAAGMLRVLGTIQHSPFPKNFKNEQKDLQKWVTEILDAMYPWMVSSKPVRIPFHQLCFSSASHWE